MDILGVFGSNNLTKRFKERNNFRFLSDSDRTRSFGDEYSFIVITDIHIKDGNTRGLEKLKTVIDDSNGEIRFVVAGGDISQYGSAQDIGSFTAIARSLGVPCYPVIGNHDIYFGNWSVWKDLIGSTCYRINGDSATLLILDTANAFFGKDQIDWLHRQLQTAQGRVFVFSHVNFFVTSAADYEQFTDNKERARIISILHNRCEAVFMGHLHKRIITELGNVQYINIEDYRDNRAYCLVSVKKTGVSYKFEKL